MIVGVAKETFPGERRVALVPANVPLLTKAGLEVRVEPGAGVEAGYPDAEYADKGAAIAADRSAVFAADILLQVRTAGANAAAFPADLPLLRKGQVVVGACDPLGSPAASQQMATSGVMLFALELLPRITRAQAMDILSSMATVAGYRAVLLAATALPKLFPMMMTAAGTLAPARVLVVGAGVAGLQAIATARKLGGVVSAYDVRPAVKEQVQSLGAKFVELELETGAAETAGGYAREMNEEFLRRQRELMGRVVAESDVVITTASVPGKKSPVLVTSDMVARMSPGSVIVDLAAERGGNCELTRADETVVSGGVTILGPTDLPSQAPYHASQMFGRNVANFVLNLIDKKTGALRSAEDDEIIRDTLVARDGQVVHPRVAELLGLITPAAAENSEQK